MYQANTLVSSAERPNKTQTPRPPTLPGLTSLRFIAAFLVVLTHFSIGTLQTAPEDEWLGPRPLQMIALNGFVAVSFFFALSGFILTYSYREPSGTLRGGSYHFIISRLARIYPVYIVGLVLGIGPYLWMDHPPHDVVKSATVLVSMTQSWWPSGVGGWDGPNWTLSVEAGFYLLFPLLLPLLTRGTSGRLIGRAIICWLLCSILGLIPGLTFSLLHEDFVLRFLPEFALGMTLGALYLNRGETVSRVAGRLFMPAALSVLIVLGVAPIYPRSTLAPIVPIVLDPLFALLILGAAARPPRLLTWRFAVMLGEASYALYLIHFPVWQWLTAAWPRSTGTGGESLPQWDGLTTSLNTAFFVCYLGIVVVLSVLVYRLVECPARRIVLRAGRRNWNGLSRRLPTRRSQPAVSTVLSAGRIGSSGPASNAASDAPMDS